MKKIIRISLLLMLFMVSCISDGCDEYYELANVSFNPNSGNIIEGQIITASFEYRYYFEDSNDHCYITMYARSNNGNRLYLVTKKLRDTGSGGESSPLEPGTLEFEVDDMLLNDPIYAYPFELSIALETLNGLMETTILDESAIFTFTKL